MSTKNIKHVTTFLYHNAVSPEFNNKNISEQGNKTLKLFKQLNSFKQLISNNKAIIFIYHS